MTVWHLLTCHNLVECASNWIVFGEFYEWGAKGIAMLDLDDIKLEEGPAPSRHTTILTFTNTSLNRGSNQLELVRLTELEPLPEPRLVGPESDAHLAVGVNLRAVVPSEIVKLVPFDL